MSAKVSKLIRWDWRAMPATVTIPGPGATPGVGPEVTPDRSRDPELVLLWAGGVAADHGPTAEADRRPGPDPNPCSAALAHPGDPVRFDGLVEGGGEVELSLHLIGRAAGPWVAGTAGRRPVVAGTTGSGEVGDGLGDHGGVEHRLGRRSRLRPHRTRPRLRRW